jgi:hypothetical protein
MKRASIFTLFAMLIASAGCQQSYNGNGIMFGCDGSGAGVIVRWGPPARQGMIDAGFKGIMEPYHWQSGAGFVVDHTSSPDHKRAIARGLADKVTKHHQEHPGDPIYLAGLSAGCAVVLYAIEELPAGVSVDQVILLSSSVSDDFDLTRVLPHVRGKLVAFTSERDAVLGDLAARFGTADGKKVGSRISGLHGFVPPAGASPSLRAGYAAKVTNIAWRPEFAQYGHNGGHTDVVATRFVAHFVAPLVVPAGS